MGPMTEVQGCSRFRPCIGKRLFPAILALVVLASAPLVWWAIGSTGGAGTPPAPSPSIGVVQDHPVPSVIAHLRLRDQAGNTVTLAQFRGRAVFLVPFLTSCQEECPITTGALLEMARSIAEDGLLRKVVIVEATVDPGRDAPVRLAAYAKLTGSDWPLLTGTRSTIARLWHYFGVYYQQVPEGSPPGTDWETHQPYTYDVDHSDGFILLDAHQHERFIAGGMARVGNIPLRLRGLLDREGESNLRHPGGGSWTVSESLDAIGWVLGRLVPDER
jgi:protein SCO1/2